MPEKPQRSWLPWISIGLLAALCGFLAVLQYRWTGEITVAERPRLQEQLQSRLTAASRAFSDEVTSALRALYPSQTLIGEQGREGAWAAQYLRWKSTHPHLIGEAGIETLDDQGFHFFRFDPASGKLTPAERLDDRNPGFVELPGSAGIPEHLLVQLDVEHIRGTLAPEILAAALPEFDVEVITSSQPAALIYSSPGAPAGVWENFDGSVPLLDMRFGAPFGGGPRPGKGPPRTLGRRGPPPSPARGGRGPDGRHGPESDPTRWQLRARHKSGSLEALVVRTQRRNLAVSGAVLLLILGTVAMLIRYSRQEQKLAELQMNFVAGVSHELRTPLTVIRTAAYNLRSPAFRRNENQVERYGRMIEAESGKLDSLVEQVLSFAGGKAGRAVREREPVDVRRLVESEIGSLRAALDNQGVTVECDFAPELPDVSGDAGALKQAFRNLLDNALKHGAQSVPWIGVAIQSKGDSVEVRVADKGPGIPASERNHIFDPFVRGKRALSDQIHGTGLGLNLVKTIVEAHSGAVVVTTRQGGGAEFIVRLPAYREKPA